MKRRLVILLVVALAIAAFIPIGEGDDDWLPNWLEWLRNQSDSDLPQLEESVQNDLAYPAPIVTNTPNPYPVATQEKPTPTAPMPYPAQPTSTPPDAYPGPPVSEPCCVVWTATPFGTPPPPTPDGYVTPTPP